MVGLSPRIVSFSASVARADRLSSRQADGMAAAQTTESSTTAGCPTDTVVPPEAVRVICRYFGISREAYSWYRCYQAEGIEGLRTAPRRGHGGFVDL
jgi:hypothetical protein